MFNFHTQASVNSWLCNFLSAVAVPSQCLAVSFVFAFGLLGKPSIWAEVMAPIGRCRRTSPFRDPMASLPAIADTIQYLVVSFVFAFGFLGKPSIWAEIMAPIGRWRRIVPFCHELEVFCFYIKLPHAGVGEFLALAIYHQLSQSPPNVSQCLFSLSLVCLESPA